MNASLSATLAFTAILHTAGVPGGSDIATLTAEQIGSRLTDGGPAPDFEHFHYDRFGVMQSCVMAWRIPGSERVVVLYGNERRDHFAFTDALPNRATCKDWLRKAKLQLAAES